MKNKKVGIYTIQSFNYGNRLQNYALQEILKKQGYDVLSISNSAVELSIKSKIKGFIKRYLFSDQRSNFYRFNITSLSSRFDMQEYQRSLVIRTAFRTILQFLNAYDDKEGLFLHNEGAACFTSLLKVKT